LRPTYNVNSNIVFAIESKFSKGMVKVMALWMLMRVSKLGLRFFLSFSASRPIRVKNLSKCIIFALLFLKGFELRSPRDHKRSECYFSCTVAIALAMVTQWKYYFNISYLLLYLGLGLSQTCQAQPMRQPIVQCLNIIILYLLIIININDGMSTLLEL